MIQDIFPHIFHNEYRPETAKGEDPVFVFEGQEVLVERESRDGTIQIPTASSFAESDLQYLFQIDRTPYYLYRGGEKPEPEGFQYQSTRIFRQLLPKDLCFAGMTAWHLYNWYRNHRFCGRCGGKTEVGRGERMLVCSSCGHQIFPVIAPAVIVAVIHQDKILLTRYKDRPYRGIALIAGFCEIGETVEDTVRREVMEEAGIHVKNIQYYKSQPWGFADNLLMGYYCELEGDETVHPDGRELAEAVWVPRDEIGEENADLSLTADMIMHFKEYGHRVMLPEAGALNFVMPDPSEDKTRQSGQTGQSPGTVKEGGSDDLISREFSDVPSRIRRIWHHHIPGLSRRRKGESAVVIPLVAKDGEYHILFEKRAEKLDVQPGEVCFPGGGMEPGELPARTAVRETAEELRVGEDQVEILAALDPVMGPSGASIWPFVALLHDYQGTWSEDEVDSVFTVPLSQLLIQNPDVYHTSLQTLPGDDFPYALIPGGREYGWRSKKNPIYFYNGWAETIWGVTARILYEFLDIYKKEED